MMIYYHECRYTGLDDQEFDSDYNEEDRFLPQYAEVLVL